MIGCPKCGHDNELGRIFCSKCGEKLDIKRIQAPSGVRRMAKQGKKQAPVGKRVSLFIGKIFKLAFVAAVVAMLTLVLLPARVDRKPITVQNLDAFQEKHSQLEDAVTVQQKVAVTFAEGDVNARMAQTVGQTIKSAGETQALQLESIYLAFEKGAVVVTVQQKWKWFRLTAQLRAKPEQAEGKWGFRATRAWVGRFPLPSWLPPQAHEKVGAIFSGLWKEFEIERQWLEQFESIEIQPGRLVILTKAAS